MTQTAQIIACFLAHPDWSSPKIGAEIGCREEHVRIALRRHGYQLARERGRPNAKNPYVAPKPLPGQRKLIKAAGC